MAMLDELTVANGDYRVRIWRKGSGRPLLFLHGFEGHPGDVPYLNRLAETHQVIAPEHPGFGESSGGEHIDDVLDAVLFYRQLAETLGVLDLNVVGHSLGGMFAAEFAAIYPHLVHRLVLVAPFGLWLEQAQIADPFVMTPGQFQRSTWHDPESVVAKESTARLANGTTGIAATVTRAGNFSTAGKFLWPIPDRGLSRRLHLITAPTLIVLGGSDRLIDQPYGEAFAAGIRGAKVITIANAGHQPMAERQDDFLDAVTPFLAG